MTSECVVVAVSVTFGLASGKLFSFSAFTWNGHNELSLQSQAGPYHQTGVFAIDRWGDLETSPSLSPSLRLSLSLSSSLPLSLSHPLVLGGLLSCAMNDYRSCCLRRGVSSRASPTSYLIKRLPPPLQRGSPVLGSRHHSQPRTTGLQYPAPPAVLELRLLSSRHSASSTAAARNSSPWGTFSGPWSTTRHRWSTLTSCSTWRST